MILSEQAEYLLYMVDVVREVGGVNDDVIDVDNNRFV